MAETGVEKLIDILRSPWRPADERIAAANGLGRTGSAVAGEALADVAHSPFSPAELRRVAAEEAGRALGGRKNRR